jgi:type III pantothenate kinase
MEDQEAEIPHVLACDVGNSGVRLADVQGEEVTPQQTLRVGDLAGLAEKLAALWGEMPEPRKIVAASVNPPALKALEAAASETLHQEVLVVGRELPLPIQVDLPNPKAVGTDRLCCAVAAYDRLGRSCVVADYGTAVTVDCVSDEGVFLGGAIMPGLALSARSLHEHTALLPSVQIALPHWVFGKDTVQAMIGGIVAAARGALRELVEAYATELGHWPTVILTGGDAQLVCPNPNESELVQAIVPDLALRGAALAYYNTLVKGK